MATTTKQSAVITLVGDRTLVITREFDAPAHLVWRVNTEPELIRRWWHANRGEVTECAVDLRVGGKWRWVQVTPDGYEVAFSGEYREIDPGRRLVSTELFEGSGLTEADASVNTVTLTEVDGRTTMRVEVVHTKPEHRTAHIESGMEAGMQDAYDMLEEIAVELG
ncbi:SRPBCC family protein [Actinokineospora guangxiensis]|uniref:SRPBCC family protein n=1 Tax=Actinokineospora guangxiensis TaxID=1490288 RepID=A0ABW0EV67_9PSEU